MENDKSSPNQVQIKINAGGLCYSDIHITKGKLPFSLNFSLILGHANLRTMMVPPTTLSSFEHSLADRGLWEEYDRNYNGADWEYDEADA
jgi:hypothetical protein